VQEVFSKKIKIKIKIKIKENLLKMSCSSVSASDNASILASALTSLTGSQVITQSDYLNQMNGNGLTYQNLNPLSLDSLHNSYLAGGAVQNNPTNYQQNNDLNSVPVLCTLKYNLYLQQYIYSNSLVIPNNLMISPPYLQQQQQQQQEQQQALQQIPPQPQISQDPIVITIIISMLNGQSFSISKVPIVTNISSIKTHIERVTKISSSQQRLTYSGIQLMDDLTLSYYNILENGSIIYLSKLLRDVIGFIDSNFLDPAYDCDFTNVKDDKEFMRGSHVYRRPCGWKRIAVKVLNKYGDNTWLGTNRKGSWRYDSDPMEWPVSYHGTDKFNAKSIAEIGFDVTKGKRFKFGYGIYSTPNIDIAALYAKKFVHNGEIYCLVFQNRVNPDTLVRINTSIVEYWISPNSDDIRPYGICIRRLPKI
jgi:hypothetical protein